MSCPRPKVNPPECDISYLEDHPYAYAIFIVALTLSATVLCQSWATLENLVSSGCIRFTLDYFIFLLSNFGITASALWATNPSGYVSGRLIDAAFTALFMLGSINLMLILPLKVMLHRKLYYRYFNTHMGGKEMIVYGVLLVINVAPGLVPFLLYFLYILGKVTHYSTGVAHGVFNLLSTVTNCILSFAWLCFLHHLARTGQHEALKVIDSSKPTWFVILLAHLVFIAYPFIGGQFTNPDLYIDQSTMPDSATARDLEFFSKCVLIIIAALAFLSFSKSISRRLRDIWGVPKLPARAMVKSCVCTLVVYFGSVVIPQLLPFETMKTYLIWLFFSACLGITAWLLWKNPHRHDEEELLEDWCVAGLLVSKQDEKKYGKTLARVLFYGAWMINLGSRASILFSLVSSPYIPWLEDTRMQEMDMYEVFNLNFLGKMQLFQSIAFVMMLITILGNVAIESALHFSAPDPHSLWRQRVRQITSFLSFMLYVPGLFPALRIINSGIECSPDKEDGVGVKKMGGTLAAFPGIQCKDDAHRLLVLIVMACLTWFVGVKALIYSHDSLFIFKPRLTMDPRGATLPTLFILLIEAVRKYIAPLNDWLATFLGIGIAISVLISEYKLPNLIGLPKEKAMQLSVIACMVEVHFASLLNFIWPHQWVPFIIMILFFPVTAVSAYVLSLRGQNNEKIDDRARALRACDFKSKEALVDARDLGALLHTRDFYDYLLEVLRSSRLRRRVRVSKVSGPGSLRPLSEHIAHESDAIVRALDLISSALSVDCGRRALASSPDLVRAVSPFLSFPNTKVAANTAICAMSSVDSLAPYLRTHALKLLLIEWASNVHSMSFHTQASHTIRNIKGGEKIILYMFSSADMDVSPLHTLLSGRVVSVKIGRRQVWLVPYDAHASSHSFVPADPIDGVLIFPPDLPVPLHLLRDALVDCHRLCIPSKPDFVDFHSVAGKNTSGQPPAAADDDDRRRQRSLLRSLFYLASNTEPSPRATTTTRGSADNGSAQWCSPVPCSSARASHIRTTPGENPAHQQQHGNHLDAACPSLISLSAPPADIHRPSNNFPLPQQTHDRTTTYNHLFILRVDRTTGRQHEKEDFTEEDPLHTLIHGLSLYLVGKIFAWSPMGKRKTRMASLVLARARGTVTSVGERAKKMFRRTTVQEEI